MDTGILSGFLNVIFTMALGVFLFIALLKTFFVVEQQSVSVIERLGKYNRTAHPGLNLKIPFIEWVSGTVSLRILQLDVEVETKTKDNVFIKLQVSVQSRVKADQVYNAFYKLDNDKQQITAYVFDVVRAQVPKMLLDNVFEEKESIADAVRRELSDTMQEFGYEIVKALVTDIQPDQRVKSAMNEINEQQRLRVAAAEKGEAEKILRVKQAEGEAESKKLQGEGIANQRKAIIEGFRISVDELKKSNPGAESSTVMSMVLMSQYFDTLKEIAAHNKSSTILLPYSPGALKDVASQLQESILVGNLASKDS